MITLDLLINHQTAIPQLAQIWYDVLGKIWVPEITIERVEKRFREHLHAERMPLTYVAFHNHKVVGMCSLRENDGIRPDLMPWLGSLVVDPDYQNQGIGKLLINAIKEKAIQSGFKALYLFTFDPSLPDFYKKLGWQKIEMNTFANHPVTVMQIKLPAC